jgi:four helix bundle suffix protein
VARSSLQELREDYRDFLISRNMPIWTAAHARYSQMQTFCRNHNRLEDYQPYLAQWNGEEMANIALTLCYMVDTMLNRHLISLEKEFVTQGGIKERMHAARTGYRQQEQNELHALRQQVKLQAEEIDRLQRLIKAHGITI